VFVVAVSSPHLSLEAMALALVLALLPLSPGRKALFLVLVLQHLSLEVMALILALAALVLVLAQ
jgi:hypothetical protein